MDIYGCLEDGSTGVGVPIVNSGPPPHCIALMKTLNCIEYRESIGFKIQRCKLLHGNIDANTVCYQMKKIRKESNDYDGERRNIWATFPPVFL